MRILKVVAVAMLLVSVLTVCASAQTPAPHSVTLTWADTQNPAGTTYTIYRAPSACTGTPAFVKITSGLTVKTYTDAAVQPGTYCYTATATLGGLESIDSNNFLAPVAPFPPTGLQVVVSPAVVVP